MRHVERRVILILMSMPWRSSLLKNQSFNQNNPRHGHTKECKDAMTELFWEMKRAMAGKWKWKGGRLKITLTAYVANRNIDAQNLVDAVSDALEVALGVNDKHFDISPIRKVDKENPRIEIRVEHTEHTGETNG